MSSSFYPKDGRRNPEGNQNYSVTQIWDLHQEIIRRLVLGMKPKDIARELDITPQTVSNVRNEPLVREQLERLHSARNASVEEIRKEVVRLVPKALTVIEDTLDDYEEKTQDRLRAALGLMDHALPKRADIATVSAALSAEDIERLRNRAFSKEGNKVCEEDNNGGNEK